MSKPDKRYYKINIHGQEQVFTNVEKVDKGYIANGVDKDGKAYQFYHRLSQEQIDSAIISNSMVFVEKPTDVVFRFYLVNASEYDKGNKETSGIWLDFPAGIKHIENAFEEIGLLPHAVQGEYMFDDFHLYSEKLHSVIKPTESLDELNYFSALVFRMDDGMCDRFMNEIEKDKNIKNLIDLINHANKMLGLAARYNGDKSTIPAEYRVTMEPASIKRSIKKQLEENKGKAADIPAAQAKNKKNDLEV